MCLTVSYVPSNKRTRFITPCFKSLNKIITDLSRDIYLYRTPYRETKIPRSGWLFPTIQLHKNKKFYWGKEIHGGLIHAYLNQTYSGHSGQTLYKAYAFGVEAFEGSGGIPVSEWQHTELDELSSIELVCRALYIPDTDMTGNAKDTLDIINSLPYKLNKSILLKKLPILKKIERYL